MRLKKTFRRIKSLWYVISHATEICEDINNLNATLDCFMHDNPDHELSKIWNEICWGEDNEEKID
jgi:hypothetical protein